MRLTLAAGLIAAAFALPATAQVKLAHDSPADPTASGTYVWGHAFAEALRASGMEVDEFERGALGDEAERLDQLSQGLLEVSMSDLRSAGQLDSLIFGAYLPYFFEDSAELDRALHEGGMLARVNEGTTPKGVRVLGFAHLGLSSGIFNTKSPVASVEDMADLRMRALDELQIALYEAWGSNGTIVSWGEVPNALQTGVADGYINPPFVPLMFGHTGFIKHYTDARIIPSTRLALASEDWYQGLSEEDRAKVDAAVMAADAANREWLESRGDILAELEKAGIAVIELSPEARAEFQRRSEAVYESGPVSAEQIAIWEKALGR